MRQNHFLYSSLFLILLTVFAVTLLSCYPVREETLAPALAGVSLVIDPGHGGPDAGVTGKNGTPEDDVNLAISLKLAEYCRRAGANVTLTRETEQSLASGKREDLQARVDLAAQAEADLFLSLHCNSYIGDRQQHGAQVFYQQNNEAGKLLAETLQTSLAENLGNTDRVALKHPDSYLLKNIPGAAVIVEMGFLTNPEEEQRLTEEAYQWDMAWAIYLGIVKTLTMQ